MDAPAATGLSRTAFHRVLPYEDCVGPTTLGLAKGDTLGRAMGSGLRTVPMRSDRRSDHVPPSLQPIVSCRFAALDRTDPAIGHRGLTGSSSKALVPFPTLRSAASKRRFRCAARRRRWRRDLRSRYASLRWVAHAGRIIFFWYFSGTRSYGSPPRRSTKCTDRVNLIETVSVYSSFAVTLASSSAWCLWYLSFSLSFSIYLCACSTLACRHLSWRIQGARAPRS